MNWTTISLMSLWLFFTGFQQLCLGGHTFLFIEDLKEYVAAYSLNAGDLQHEIPLVRKLQLKQPDPPKSIVKFLFYAAFDCLCNLLLISVTLLVTSASCERNFSEMKLVKTFLRNSMHDDWVSELALLSSESLQAEGIDLKCFVDEFDSHHDNLRIKLDWFFLFNLHGDVLAKYKHTKNNLSKNIYK